MPQSMLNAQQLKIYLSTTEAECGCLLPNYSTTIGIQNASIGMGNPQGETPAIINNLTANSFAHSEMRVKQTKS